MGDMADQWMNRQISWFTDWLMDGQTDGWTKWLMKEQMNWWMNKLMNEHGEQTDQNCKDNNKWKEFSYFRGWRFNFVFIFK